MYWSLQYRSDTYRQFPRSLQKRLISLTMDTCMSMLWPKIVVTVLELTNVKQTCPDLECVTERLLKSIWAWPCNWPPSDMYHNDEEICSTWLVVNTVCHTDSSTRPPRVSSPVSNERQSMALTIDIDILWHIWSCQGFWGTGTCLSGLLVCLNLIHSRH